MSGPPSLHSHSAALNEANRTASTGIAFGVVMAVDLSDPAAPRATVNVNGIRSAPLPWLAQRAGSDSDWWAPEVNEQVVVAAAYGDTTQGVILGSLYSETFPAPSTDADLWQRTFKDGTILSYDHSAHVLTVDASAASGTVTINCQSATITAQNGVTVNGDVTVNGSIAASGDVSANGISLDNHVHSGVQTGGGMTGKPQG